MYLNDAKNRTESWRLRHSPEARAALGVWRWQGIDRHKLDILRLCAGKRVVDFGGADGPLGLGATVVDLKAECKSLDNVQGKVDVIFTSHTLEHCKDVRGILRAMYAMMEPDGYLIAHVPAWTCDRWRAGGYENPAQEPHLWTFGLADDGPVRVGHYLKIDMEIRAAGFHVDAAEHCGDNSLLVIGVKRG